MANAYGLGKKMLPAAILRAQNTTISIIFKTIFRTAFPIFKNKQIRPNYIPKNTLKKMNDLYI
jgi:hypothetical protein